MSRRITRSAAAAAKAAEKGTAEAETVAKSSTVSKRKKSDSSGTKRKTVEAPTRRLPPANSAQLAEILAGARDLPNTLGGWSLYEGLTHLLTCNPLFERLIARHGIPKHYVEAPESALQVRFSAFPVKLYWKEPPFMVLLRNIVYQQLAGSVADTIWLRFLSCFGVAEGQHVEPRQVAEGKYEVVVDEKGKRKQLINGKPSGLSVNKGMFVKSLAEAFLADLHSLNWADSSDEELLARLTAVKGLGPWSVHMFMMFGLHRPDVIAVGDLGLRRGLCLLHDLDMNHFEGKNKEKLILEHFQPFRPYSSLANFYLWKLYEERNGLV